MAGKVIPASGVDGANISSDGRIGGNLSGHSLRRANEKLNKIDFNQQTSQIGHECQPEAEENFGDKIANKIRAEQLTTESLFIVYNNNTDTDKSLRKPYIPDENSLNTTDPISIMSDKESVDDGFRTVKGRKNRKRRSDDFNPEGEAMYEKMTLQAKIDEQEKTIKELREQLQEVLSRLNQDESRQPSASIILQEEVMQFSLRMQNGQPMQP